MLFRCFSCEFICLADAVLAEQGTVSGLPVGFIPVDGEIERMRGEALVGLAEAVMPVAAQRYWPGSCVMPRSRVGFSCSPRVPIRLPR